MAKIFISYRRDDSQYQADKLHAALKPHVANPRTDIFIDVDNIPLGVDFATHLEGKVGECEVLLALIGDEWLNIRDPATGRRRLDDPKDFVRIEIAAALQRGIPVVPVLFDGASIPPAEDLPEDLKPLARRNGLPVTRASFDSDMLRLVNGLPIDLPGKRKAKAPAGGKPGKSYAGFILGGLAVVGVGLGGVLVDPLGWFIEEEVVSQAEAPAEAAATAEPFAELIDPDIPGTAPDFYSVAEKIAGKEPRASAPDAMGTAAERAVAIRELQTALKTLGHYTSGIDGAAGPGTQRAADAFASVEGIPAPNVSGAELPVLAKFADRANQAAEELSRREAAAWSIARAADTKAAHEAFLSDFPTGANARSARARIAAIEAAARPISSSPSPVAAISGSSDHKKSSESLLLQLAIPDFGVIGADNGSAKQIADVVRADLASTGLFDLQKASFFVQRDLSINAEPRFADWKIIRTEGLVVGAFETWPDDMISVSIRLWDVQGEELMRINGDPGKRLTTSPENVEHLGHRIADIIYTVYLGKDPYFEEHFIAGGGIVRE